MARELDAFNSSLQLFMSKEVFYFNGNETSRKAQSQELSRSLSDKLVGRRKVSDQASRKAEKKEREPGNHH